MSTIFLALCLIILCAFIISFVAKFFKQPLILAYIVAGIFISVVISLSPPIADILKHTESIMEFSEFGVAFLLFIVGLHLNPKVIKEVGFTSLLVGLIQIVLTFFASFFISSYLLGFSLVVSVYIAFALTFSSTIIITKLLYDKQGLETLYGKIALGILIVQDLVAILALMAAPYFSSPDKLTAMSPTLLSIIYSILVFPALIFASLYILPGITKFVAKNQELLFLFSVGWVFLLASLFAHLGFSMEIGALLAGISLSVSPYHFEIASKIKPLRDFFLIIFFIFLGLNFDIANFSSIIKPALILSAFVIIFKSLVILISLGALGYTKRTSFITGLTLGQISEFSFILVGLGFALGQISSEIVQIITLTGLITIGISTYFITYSDGIYSTFSKHLKIFEKKSAREKTTIKHKPDAILLGYNRIGYSMLKAFSKLKKNCLVVDFNPDTINRISKKGITSVYGDAGDSELLDEIKVQDAKLIISTVPNFDDNLMIAKKVREINPKAIIIVTARQIDGALEAYEAGADYVVLPHFLGGEYISHLVERFDFNKKLYEKEKAKHLKELKDRILEGHEHPEVTRG